MDRQEYTSLQAALTGVPDPRQARGRRYQWSLLLTVVAAAVASGQRNLRAIGQWVHEHADEVLPALDPPHGRLPSPATLRRVVRAVDLTALEAQVSAFVAGLPGPAPTVAGLIGYALDGKAVRGANRQGARVHLVSLARHGDGQVLAQCAVASKSNEITAAPRLLAERALDGLVLTMDAQLTQRAIASQIRAQRGHYLMVVKSNQPALFTAIEQIFQPGVPVLASDARCQVTTISKGHGRLEERRLERTAALNAYVDWPEVGQVLRRTCRRVSLATGAVQEETSYAVTSLPLSVGPADLQAVWRGHWTIENRVHYPRDVTLGEDAGQQRRGSTPQALAALRNGLLSLWRALGWTNIADAVRHYGAYAHRAVALVTLTPSRL
jgi:predicted transposase YbfD/YdcC